MNDCVGLRVFSVFLLMAGLGAAHAQENRASPVTPTPPELSPALKGLQGRWYGTASHESESGEMACEFVPHRGKLLAKEWLPKLHIFGAPIGYVLQKDGGFSVPGFDFEFSIENDRLVGKFSVAEVSVRLDRVNRELRKEPEAPLSGSAPKILWSYRASGPIWTTPAVSDGVIVAADASGHLQAIKGGNGERLWVFDAKSPLYGEPAIVNNAVYVLGDNGGLYKVSFLSGKLIWKVDLGGAIKRNPFDSNSAAPVIADGTIYIGGGDGVFHALEADTGREVWKFRTGDKIRASALVDGDRVLFGIFDHWVYALDRRTGKQLWKFDTGSAVTTAPIVAQDRVIIGTRDKSLLYALTAADGVPVWTLFHWFSWVDSAPRFVDGLLYIGSSDYRSVRALRPEDGSVVWNTDVFGWSWGTPVVVGKTVYYATAGTTKYLIRHLPSLGALDRKTGELKWRYELPTSTDAVTTGYANSLVYLDGDIIAAGLDGKIIVFKPIDWKTSNGG